MVQRDDDFKLVEQIKTGSKEAFRLVFDAYGPKILAFAIKYLKNESDAEELLQEVFLKLWEKRANLDSSKNIKSYLFKICVNQIYDFIRRRNIEQTYISYSVQNNSNSGNNTWNEVVYNDMQKSLQSFIAQMPAQMQRVFRLSKEEGLSNDEIAETLHLSKRTVENQLYRATAFLKGKFGLGTLFASLFISLFFG